MSDYDKTLVELDEATDIPDSAIGYAILDPSGTPVDRKFTWQNARKTPSRVVFVDGRYTANVTPYFDNISDALTAANAMTPTVGNPVTIKAFSDTDGSPIGLGDNDYNALRDSGIFFESVYDSSNKLTVEEKSGLSDIGQGASLTDNDDKVATQKQVKDYASREKRFAEHYPFKKTATVSNAEVFRAVIDVKLYGTNSGNDYKLAYVWRNSSNDWRLRVYENDGVGPVSGHTLVCTYSPESVSPEPSDPTEIVIIDLIESGSSGITGKIAIRWSEITDGASYGFQSATLSDLVFQDKSPESYIYQQEQLNQETVAFSGIENLRTWNAFKAKVANGDTSSQFRISILGDSWVNDKDRIQKPLRALINDTYSDAGYGYISANKNDAFTPDGITRSVNGAWTWFDKDDSPYGVDMHHAKTSDTGALLLIDPDTNVDEYVIHWVQQTNGGTFEWRLGASGTKTSVDTSGGTSYQTTTIDATGDTGANNTLYVTFPTAGSDGIIICGVEANQNSGGVIIDKIGNGGATAQDYVDHVNSTYFRSAFTKINPDMLVILLGTNDASGGDDLEDFYDDLGFIISRVKASTSNYTDVLLLGAGPNDVADINPYNKKIAKLASSNGYAFINLRKYFGSYDQADDNGLYSDTVHPNADGGYVIAQTIANHLLNK